MNPVEDINGFKLRMQEDAAAALVQERIVAEQQQKALLQVLHAANEAYKLKNCFGVDGKQTENALKVLVQRMKDYYVIASKASCPCLTEQLTQQLILPLLSSERQTTVCLAAESLKGCPIRENMLADSVFNALYDRLAHILSNRTIYTYDVLTHAAGLLPQFFLMPRLQAETLLRAQRNGLITALISILSVSRRGACEEEFLLQGLQLQVANCLWFLFAHLELAPQESQQQALRDLLHRQMAGAPLKRLLVLCTAEMHAGRVMRVAIKALHSFTQLSADSALLVVKQGGLAATATMVARLRGNSVKGMSPQQRDDTLKAVMMLAADLVPVAEAVHEQEEEERQRQEALHAAEAAASAAAAEATQPQAVSTKSSEHGGTPVSGNHTDPEPPSSPPSEQAEIDPLTAAMLATPAMPIKYPPFGSWSTKGLKAYIAEGGLDQCKGIREKSELIALAKLRFRKEGPSSLEAATSPAQPGSAAEDVAPAQDAEGTCKETELHQLPGSNTAATELKRPVQAPATTVPPPPSSNSTQVPSSVAPLASKSEPVAEGAAVPAVLVEQQCVPGGAPTRKNVILLGPPTPEVQGRASNPLLRQLSVDSQSIDSPSTKGSHAPPRMTVFAGISPSITLTPPSTNTGHHERPDAEFPVELMTVAQLKRLLLRANVDYSHCVEKKELVALAKKLPQQLLVLAAGDEPMPGTGAAAVAPSEEPSKAAEAVPHDANKGMHVRNASTLSNMSSSGRIEAPLPDVFSQAIPVAEWGTVADSLVDVMVVQSRLNSSKAITLSALCGVPPSALLHPTQKTIKTVKHNLRTRVGLHRLLVNSFLSDMLAEAGERERCQLAAAGLMKALTTQLLSAKEPEVVPAALSALASFAEVGSLVEPLWDLGALPTVVQLLTTVPVHLAVQDPQGPLFSTLMAALKLLGNMTMPNDIPTGASVMQLRDTEGAVLISQDRVARKVASWLVETTAVPQVMKLLKAVLAHPRHKVAIAQQFPYLNGKQLVPRYPAYQCLRLLRHLVLASPFTAPARLAPLTELYDCLLALMDTQKEALEVNRSSVLLVWLLQRHGPGAQVPREHLRRLARLHEVAVRGGLLA